MQKFECGGRLVGEVAHRVTEAQRKTKGARGVGLVVLLCDFVPWCEVLSSVCRSVLVMGRTEAGGTQRHRGTEEELRGMFFRLVVLLCGLAPSREVLSSGCRSVLGLWAARRTLRRS
jgi:hypothetical protein